MQKVIMFTASALSPTMDSTVETQLSNYIYNNPTHKIVSTSYVVVGALEKLLTVFDIPDEKTPVQNTEGNQTKYFNKNKGDNRHDK